MTTPLCLDCEFRLDPGFALDERIEASSSFITHLNLCQIRLSHESRWPWLILVPTIADATEITDLSDAQLIDLMADIRAAETMVRRLADEVEFPVTKLNIANLGNIVAQLHIHVIARNSGDPAWPGPVWGFGQSLNHAPAQQHDLVHTLRRAL